VVVRSKPRSRGDSIARNRWLVHLALILGFLAAVISAVFLSRKYLGHSGTTDHSIIGLLVLVLVIVHLTQRRHTVRRLIDWLVGRLKATEHQTRLAVSDTILWILVLNAMVSGVADFLVGHTIFLPIPGPNILQKWHAMSVLVLLVYVIVHVVQRRKRLRTSHIR
jgi:hypothetical protein